MEGEGKLLIGGVEKKGKGLRGVCGLDSVCGLI